MTFESPSSSPTDDARDVWQEQPARSFQMSPEDLRKKHRAYDRRLRIGILMAGITSLVAMVALIGLLPELHTRLEQAGAILIVVGAGYTLLQVVQLWRQKRAAVATPRGSTRASIEFYRAALERQRDFHGGRTLWSRMIVLSPGMLMFFAGFSRANPGYASAVLTGVAVLGLIAAVPLDLRVARKFQRQIDALNRLQQEQ